MRDQLMKIGNFTINIEPDDSSAISLQEDEFHWNSLSVHPREKRLDGGNDLYGELLGHRLALGWYEEFRLEEIFRDCNEAMIKAQCGNIPSGLMYFFEVEQAQVKQAIMGIFDRISDHDRLDDYLPDDFPAFSTDAEYKLHADEYMQDLESIQEIAESLLRLADQVPGYEWIIEVLAEALDDFIWGYPFIHFVSLYEHSGIHLSLANNPFSNRPSREWDSTPGAAIIIAATEEWARSQIDYMNDLGNGSVYWYSVTYDDFGNEIFVASCGGFVGDDHKKSGLMEYALNEIECFKYQRAEDDYLIRLHDQGWVEARWENNAWRIRLTDDVVTDCDISEIREI